MAVDDEKAEARDDQQPRRDERHLRDEPGVCVLVCHEEDEAEVHERRHEEANRELRHPVVKKAIEKAWTEERRHHRQHEQCNREDEREDRAHAPEHRAQDRAGIVDAPHREPCGQMDDSECIEDVGHHRDAEERHAPERQREGDLPEVHVRT